MPLTCGFTQRWHTAGTQRCRRVQRHTAECTSSIAVRGRLDTSDPMTTDVSGSPADMAWGPEQVAQYLRISVRHLHDLRAEDPTFPQARMLGRAPRWEPGVVRDWLAAGTPQDRATSARRSRSRGAGTGAGRVH